jgi:hypothetical protein
MTVYEIPNINHCTVEEMASGRMYRITANEGWYIHVNFEGNENIYKGAVILSATYDFTTVEIISENELPEGAEIYGATTTPETV